MNKKKLPSLFAEALSCTENNNDINIFYCPLYRNLSPAPPQNTGTERDGDADAVEVPQKLCIAAYLADLCGDANEGIDGQCALSSLQSSFHKPQSTHPKRSDIPAQSALKMINSIYEADVSINNPVKQTHIYIGSL